MTLPLRYIYFFVFMRLGLEPHWWNLQDGTKGAHRSSSMLDSLERVSREWWCWQMHQGMLRSLLSSLVLESVNRRVRPHHWGPRRQRADSQCLSQHAFVWRHWQYHSSKNPSIWSTNSRFGIKSFYLLERSQATTIGSMTFSFGMKTAW